MDRDRLMRRALWTTSVFNVGGALAFAFPASLGQLMGLPASVPLIYRASMAFFVLLFGGCYAWLAAQPQIDRPMVAMTAIGKAGFFLLTLACWSIGELPAVTTVAASGDLAFAALFAWWLATAPDGLATAHPAGRRPV